MPVVEGLEPVVVGTISAADINRQYRLALKRSGQRMRDITIRGDGVSDQSDQPIARP